MGERDILPENDEMYPNPRTENRLSTKGEEKREEQIKKDDRQATCLFCSAAS
jgi:hypothetical protein